MNPQCINITMERHVKQKTLLEHMGSRSMWSGSMEVQDNKILAWDGSKMSIQKLTYAPTFYQIIDEIIDNCVDHWTHYPSEVTNISISLDKDGEITVTNNGAGIIVEKLKNVDGKELWSVQMIVADPLTSDNGDDTVERKTGGANGAGLKITTMHSERVEIETIDLKSHKHYTQRFRSTQKEILCEDPMIMIVPDNFPKDKTFTRVTFLPRYETFGFKDGFDLKRDGELLDKLISTRAYYAKAFCSSCDEKKSCRILYKTPSIEGEAKIANFREWANLVTDAPVLFDLTNSLALKPDVWHIALGKSDGKFRQISIVNGIVRYSGGSHIKRIKKLVTDLVENTVLKKYKTIKINTKQLFNNVSMVMVGYIDKPSSKSQIKDSVDDPESKFKGYSIVERDERYVIDFMEDVINQMCHKPSKTHRKMGSLMGIDKYVEALSLGRKRRRNDDKRVLLIGEGDSAIGGIRSAINSHETPLNCEYFGTYSIGGVPMNARKEVREIKGELHQTKRLQNNERLNNLVKILGLDYGCSYKDDDDMKKLRYDMVVLVTDQDEDGKGNIATLIVNFFSVFWSNLLKRGYVARLNTPIIRAKATSKKGYVEEFYTLGEFRDFVSKNFGGNLEALLKGYKVKYYKGLGTHEIGVENIRLYQDFDHKICRYVLDDEGEKYLEVYYGRDTDQRKKVLRNKPEIEEKREPEVKISDALRSATDDMQRDNIKRKLRCLYDGMAPAQRKIAYCSRTFCVAKEVKVCALATHTSLKLHYHHGEQCLNDTIVKMAQDFRKNLPVLLPHGYFGRKSSGGQDYAQPRYIYTILNKKLCDCLFPIVDDELLDYVYDEGEKCEPKCFVPIIPIAVLEDVEIPGTGWKIKIWARKYEDVLAMTTELIEKGKSDMKLNLWLRGYSQIIEEHGGKKYSVGEYQIKESRYDDVDKEIVVTSLPLGVYAEQFLGVSSIKTKKKKRDVDEKSKLPLALRSEMAKTPLDESNETSTKITLFLRKGAMDEIKEKYGDSDFTPLMDWMNLKRAINENLNFVDDKDNVREFKNCEDIVLEWFQRRKELYVKRITRQEILLTLRIKALKNKIRFIEEHSALGINSKISLVRASEILSENKFDMINDTALKAPQDIKTEDLEQKILKDGASYTYLLNMRYTDLVSEAHKKRLAALKELEKELEMTLDDKKGAFVGQKTWLRELKKLNEAIQNGLKNGWKEKSGDRYRD